MARVVWRLATWLAHRGIVPCPETGLAPARVGGRKPTRTHGRESACSMSTTHDTVARILDDPGWQRIQVRQRPTCGRCRDRELAHRRESRLSRMRSRSGGRATGVVIVRVPHRNAPTSGGRTPNNSSRARSSRSLVHASRSAARCCCGVGRAYGCRTLLLASRRRASVTSRIVGRSGRGRSRAGRSARRSAMRPSIASR